MIQYILVEKKILSRVALLEESWIKNFYYNIYTLDSIYDKCFMAIHNV